MLLLLARYHHYQLAFDMNLVRRIEKTAVDSEEKTNDLFPSVDCPLRVRLIGGNTMPVSQVLTLCEISTPIFPVNSFLSRCLRTPHLVGGFACIEGQVYTLLSALFLNPKESA